MRTIPSSILIGLHLLSLRDTTLHHFTSRWARLDLAQKLYLVAITLLFYNATLAALLTLVTLAIDYWPKFVGFWNTLAGKVSLLLLYACSTNFALVGASGIVNSVTGVDASHFPYAHYTAIMLVLPTWIFVSSIIVLAFIQILFPAFFLILLLLRLVGLNYKRFFKRNTYPLQTMLLRFILAWVLLSSASDFYEYINERQEDTFERIAINLEKSFDTIVNENKVAEPERDDTDTNADQVSDDPNPDAKETKGKGYRFELRKLLASFIFRFEANNLSRCQLSKGAKSVELNVYQHVEIQKDKNAPYGFSFTVRACSSPGINAEMAQ